jgi:FkbM family methyltransferase
MSTEYVQHPVYGNVRILSGDKFSGRWVKQQRIWEQSLVSQFHKYVRPDSLVLDVGANIGLHSILFSKSCNVVSFEPQPVLFDILETNIRNNQLENRITPMQFAISAKIGMELFGIPESYNVWDNPGGLGIVDASFSQSGLKTIVVQTRTIDSFNYTNVSVIKVDVEGHEREVLEGARDTIAREKPNLIVEILGGCNRNTYYNEIQGFIDWVCETFGYMLIVEVEHDYIFCPLSE